MNQKASSPVAKSNATKAMTDKEKLQAVFDSFEIPYSEKNKSFLAGGRRFYFNKKGQIERIIDYVRGIRVTDLESESDI